MEHSQVIRYRMVKVEKVYFKDFIEDDFKRQPMPETIRKQRNFSILLVFLQVIVSIVSLALYMRRRSRFFLVASLSSIFLSLIGLIGTIRINSLLMLIHCFFCVSVFGAFYVYLLLEMLFFGKKNS